LVIKPNIDVVIVDEKSPTRRQSEKTSCFRTLVMKMLDTHRLEEIFVV